MQQNEFDSLTQDGRVERLQQLARAALAHWGLESARLELLKYRENAVFKVTHPTTGERFVLRVHRAGYHTDAEVRAALIDSGIPAPSVVPAKSGALFVHVSHSSVPEARQCDMLRWVDGSIIGSIEGDHVATVEEVRTNHYLTGRLAAMIHTHGEKWARPAGFTRPQMDFEGLLGSRAYLGPYAACKLLAPDQIALLDRAAEGIRATLAAFGQTPDRYGLTHGDFLPENLLSEGDKVRIIDFDDCGFGWHVMDIATSMMFLLGEPQYEDAFTGFVGGYRSIRALPDEHLELLPVFLLTRAMTYVGWAGSRPEAKIVQEKGPVIIGATLMLAEGFLAGSQ
jgi:Ser/Thr protein kinase RdoA (MazF antagonist)